MNKEQIAEVIMAKLAEFVEAGEDSISFGCLPTSSESLTLGELVERYTHETAIASFNRFELIVPLEAIEECGGSGRRDDNVAYWQKEVDFTAIPDDKLSEELKEYGAWDADQLADRDANEKRLLWLACGNLMEEMP